MSNISNAQLKFISIFIFKTVLNNESDNLHNNGMFQNSMINNFGVKSK